MKQCTKCRLPKPLTDFHKNRRQPDGHQVWCKLCVRSYQNEKRETDREAYQEYQRQWFAAHPGYFKGYVRQPKGIEQPILVVFPED